MAEPPLTARPDRARILDPHAGPLEQILDDAVEAEIELEHETTVVEAERGLVRRVARVVAGFTLVFIGILLLVLPGPGLLVIAAGLGLLSRDVPFARRWLGIVRRRIPEGEDGEVAAWFVYGSTALVIVSVVSSIVWLVVH
jgi:Putative transmembrane protein (PGPGW)